MGCIVSIFTVGIRNQFKVISVACTLTPYKKPPQIFCDVGRELMARQITLTSVIRRQPVTIDY